MVFFIIIGLLAIVAGVAFICVNRNRKSYGKELIFQKKIIVLCVIVGLILFILGCSVSIVPTGYTGVRTTFNQISETPAVPGFNWKIPFVQNIQLVNNKQQDTNTSSEIWGETLEKTPVYAKDVIVTYQINSDKSAWIFANVSRSDKNLIEESLIASAVKSSMVTLKAAEVTNRSKIEPLVKENLNNSLTEKYGEGTINVLKVVVNDMDFEDSYNEAIAAKSIAQQTQEKQKIENDTAIAKAEADKKVAITNAEAAAEQKTIEANAEAEATRIKADAEAEANTKVAKTITKDLIDKIKAEKWNGTLPTVVGESTVLTGINEGGE